MEPGRLLSGARKPDCGGEYIANLCLPPIPPISVCVSMGVSELRSLSILSLLSIYPLSILSLHSLYTLSIIYTLSFQAQRKTESSPVLVSRGLLKLDRCKVKSNSDGYCICAYGSTTITNSEIALGGYGTMCIKSLHDSGGRLNKHFTGNTFKHYGQHPNFGGIVYEDLIITAELTEFESRLKRENKEVIEVWTSVYGVLGGYDSDDSRDYSEYGYGYDCECCG